jgi:hypothetical protein
MEIQKGSHKIQNMTNVKRNKKLNNDDLKLFIPYLIIKS